MDPDQTVPLGVIVFASKSKFSGLLQILIYVADVISGLNFQNNYHDYKNNIQ